MGNIYTQFNIKFPFITDMNICIGYYDLLTTLDVLGMAN